MQPVRRIFGGKKQGFNSLQNSAPQYRWQSRVYFYKSGGFVGRIMFMKEGVAIPANYESSGKPVIHFPTNLFEEIMAILRNEKPLFITLNTSNGIGTISTSREPIGEEED